jgi:hypothetical protein
VSLVFSGRRGQFRKGGAECAVRGAKERGARYRRRGEDTENSGDVSDGPGTVYPSMVASRATSVRPIGCAAIWCCSHPPLQIGRGSPPFLAFVFFRSGTIVPHLESLQLKYKSLTQLHGEKSVVTLCHVWMDSTVLQCPLHTVRK